MGRGIKPMWKNFLWMWIVYAAALLILFCLIVPPVGAHENWVSQGRYKNAAGEWCCGAYDCKPYNNVMSSPKGWILGAEFVPFDEAMPVAPPDSQVTVCRRPDGSRRCVFGLKPGF